jgi:hypothetical protein
MTYPSTAAIVSGTNTLMVALQQLSRQSLAGRLPDVLAGQPVWAVTRDAQGLADAGLAAFAPAGTPAPAWEPAWTAHGTPGVAFGTSNATH